MKSDEKVSARLQGVGNETPKVPRRERRRFMALKIQCSEMLDEPARSLHLSP
jgi:hypothetical protein